MVKFGFRSWGGRYFALGGVVLLVLVGLFFVLSGGGSGGSATVTVPAVVAPSSTVGTVSYALLGTSTVAVPGAGGCDACTVVVKYVGGYTVDAVVSGGSFTVVLWSGGSLLGFTSGVVGSSAPAVVRAYDGVVAVVGGSSLTLSRAASFSVRGYTFSVGGGYVYVWWSGDGYSASLACSVVSVGSPAVWVTFTTGSVEKRS